jgi:SAM-dependent methyltransferase
MIPRFKIKIKEPKRSRSVRDRHVGGFHTHGDPSTWYPDMWQWFVKTHNIKNVLDVGCGAGYAAGYFAHLGCNVTAIDGSKKALNYKVFNIKIHDLVYGPFLQKDVDLVWCCEVVEHIREEYLGHLLDTICQGKWLLMTHARPGQPGTHHVNCQHDGYWIGKIEERGCKYDDAITSSCRDMAGGFFKESGLVFKCLQ